MPTVRLEKATKIYKWEGRTNLAINEVDLSVAQGEFIFIVGSSGAGKTTLLKLICGEISPDRGAVYLDDARLGGLPAWSRPRIRLAYGKVWQDGAFMRKRTVFENLAMVARVGNTKGDAIRLRVAKALGIVGMAGVEGRYPVELSIGECRRVELARALINSPHILVLDELTANLDDDNSWDILQLLMDLNRQGTTIIMATHASHWVNIMRRRVITLVDGKIFGDVKKGKYGDVV